jgi:hypothetical protein
LIGAKMSRLKETKWDEYLLRFVFGGAATVLAGVVAKHFGAGAGGLFLAFPAIFPATATLIESHEKKRKAKIGADGTRRGRVEASIDSAGAALGCFGLAGFAVVLWRLLPRHGAAVILLAAMVVWMAVSMAWWELRKRRVFGVRLRVLR